MWDSHKEVLMKATVFSAMLRRVDWYNSDVSEKHAALSTQTKKSSWIAIYQPTKRNIT